MLTAFAFDGGGGASGAAPFSGSVLYGVDTYGLVMSGPGNIWASRSGGPVLYTQAPGGSFTVTCEVQVAPASIQSVVGLSLYAGGGANLPFTLAWDTWAGGALGEASFQARSQRCARAPCWARVCGGQQPALAAAAFMVAWPGLG